MLIRTMAILFFNRPQFLQFGKYFIAGGCAALIEWGVFWLFSSRFQVFYLYSVAIAFVVATSVNYLLSAFFVFVRGRHSTKVEIFLVFFVSAIGLGMNSLLMWILHGNLKMSGMPAKILSTGLVFIWNYFSRRIFIFRTVSDAKR
jgi:putative flippase GtrA